MTSFKEQTEPLDERNEKFYELWVHGRNIDYTQDWNRETQYLFTQFGIQLNTLVRNFEARINEKYKQELKQKKEEFHLKLDQERFMVAQDHIVQAMECIKQSYAMGMDKNGDDRWR